MKDLFGIRKILKCVQQYNPNSWTKLQDILNVPLIVYNIKMRDEKTFRSNGKDVSKPGVSFMVKRIQPKSKDEDNKPRKVKTYAKNVVSIMKAVTEDQNFNNETGCFACMFTRSSTDGPFIVNDIPDDVREKLKDKMKELE